MTDLESVQAILTEIRDTQQLALANQQRLVALAEDQAERARRQIEESLALQREAIAKQRTVMRIAFPGIVFCIAMIAYLVFRYF